ncbi:MAG: beta-lactamase family protein [Bryobacteraceae bacterium]|nr:beta-lactamase family protein [Bryobacteraceae bacterium]
MNRRTFTLTFTTPVLMMAAQDGIPETPAGRLLRLWLTAFNSGDRAQLVDFRAKYAPDQPDHVEQMMQTRRFTGGFEVRRVEPEEEGKLKAILKEREGDTHARIELHVASADPLRAGRITVQRIETPEDLAPAAMNERELCKALDERAQDMARRDQFSGSVLLARGTDVVFEQAYGWADRDAKIANTMDTRFRIGSMNKMFTAVAVLQLVEKGKLALEAPLGEYLREYPNAKVAAKVQIRHLLNHTGGTGDIFGPEFASKRLELRTLGDYLKLYGGRELAFEPGANWAYSNYGFLLLGAVIEQVAGRGYYEQVKESVYRPAGMTGSGSQPEEEPVPQRSKGYQQGSAGWKSNADTLPWRGTPAGGGYSTTRDLFRFARALETGKLLGEKLRREATTAQKAGAGYGYGFQVREKPMRQYGHGGGAPGMNGDLRVLPDSGYVLAVLSNLDPPAAGRLTDFVMARLKISAKR